MRIRADPDQRRSLPGQHHKEAGERAGRSLGVSFGRLEKSLVYLEGSGNAFARRSRHSTQMRLK